MWRRPWSSRRTFLTEQIEICCRPESQWVPDRLVLDVAVQHLCTVSCVPLRRCSPPQRSSSESLVFSHENFRGISIHRGNQSIATAIAQSSVAVAEACSPQINWECNHSLLCYSYLASLFLIRLSLSPSLLYSLSSPFLYWPILNPLSQQMGLGCVMSSCIGVLSEAAAEIEFDALET